MVTCKLVAVKIKMPFAKKGCAHGEVRRNEAANLVGVLFLFCSLTEGSVHGGAPGRNLYMRFPWFNDFLMVLPTFSWSGVVKVFVSMGLVRFTWSLPDQACC